MTELKSAVERAKAFATDILGQSDLLVEEVRTEPDAFFITLSLPRRAGKTLNPVLTVPGARDYAADREFKEFRVNKNDGAVTSMSIRLVAG